MKRIVLSVLAATALFANAGFASAGPEIFDDSVSNCTGPDCSTLRIPGTVLSRGSSASAWVGQVFAKPNECLRLRVRTADTDLRMVVVAPNGQVFQNDDGHLSPNPLAPVVNIASAPSEGWYTLHLSHWTGAAVSANFVLVYGRYGAGNVNCTTATPPLAAAALNPAGQAKPDSGVAAPAAGTPGAQ